jgi:predicted lipoprotein
MKFSKLLLLSFVALTFVLSSCKDDEMTGGDPCTSNFNQKAMFENVADNLILPQMKDFQGSVDDLHLAVTTFIDAANTENYEVLLAALTDSWTQWQSVAQYSFGPAEEVFLRNSLNNFPLNITEMQTKIMDGNTDFSSPDDFDKGFPALDYLFIGIKETIFTPSVVDFYSSSEDDEPYKNYARAVIEDIKTRTDAVVNKWEGAYRDEFVNNTGTAAGTSLSLIINGLNQNYELIKREKLGVPSGVLTLGFSNPDKVEAPGLAISKELALEALKASKSLYLGMSVSDADGLGLDDYLTEVNALKSEEKLDDLIQNQFEVAIRSIENLELTLQEEARDNQENVENAYAEVTKNLVNLKTDLPSVLCVSITYIDNPSDSD